MENGSEESAVTTESEISALRENIQRKGAPNR